MLLAAALPGRAAEEGGAFNLSQPAPGLYVHQGRPLALDAPGHDDIANIGFILGSRCVAVIDTGGSVRIGRALRAAIRRRTSLPICYVLNTHVHVDHVLGNAAFKDDHPSFVGHTALAQAIVRNRSYFLKEYPEDFEAPASLEEVIGPDRLVESDVTLDLGHRVLRLHAWPVAHTDCDLSVYDETTRALWTGDLVFRERLPALDGSLPGWLAVIEQLSSQPVKLVVPGHGPPTTDLAGALDRERGYLKSLLEGVRQELAEGKSEQDAMAHVGAGQGPGWLLWAEVHPRNVARAYEELEWEQ